MEQAQLQGKIVRLTYQDPYSGFVVAKLLPKNSRIETTLVGYIPYIQVGQDVSCLGLYEFHPRHGKQFTVQKLSYELPKDLPSIEKLLASGFLKGIGPVRAKMLVTTFGTQTFHVLEHSPEQLYSIPKFGKKAADECVKSWKERTELQEIYLILCDYGLSHIMATKVLRRYKSSTIQIIQKNPYQLAKEIAGIGFQAADAIATKIGIDPLSPIRVDAALEFLLWSFCELGHTCVPEPVFITHAEEKIQAPRPFIKERIEELIKTNIVVRFDQEPLTATSPKFLALKTLFDTEATIISTINTLCATPCALRSVDTEKAIPWAETTLKMTFAAQQKEAITAALTEKVCIITGGPGTGKSTITKAILAISSKLTEKIVLAAPTGRAAKRLSEMVHKQAHTIHRLLKYNPGMQTFEHNAQNPLAADLIIIDESSMIDTHLAQNLFDAIPKKARVLLIGDVDQLPSIGPGTILKDLICYNDIKTIRLTEIFRQSKHSHIIQSAHRINQGKMPFLTDTKSDFLFIKNEDPALIRQKIISLVTKEIPEKYHIHPTKDIQVLSPMRRGEIGIDQLNIDLQASFFPKKPPSAPFAIGDKVIQCKNNYKKDVFNGDIGYVVHIHPEEGHVEVDFDEKRVLYDPITIDELRLAWAVSIHKYQGSECPCIIIPIHTQHFKLLNKNLLYTGVTRGKRLVILIGTPKAIAIAVNARTHEERWTNLRKGKYPVRDNIP